MKLKDMTLKDLKTRRIEIIPIEVVTKGELKEWAITKVKALDKQSELCDPKKEIEEYAACRVILEWIMENFNLTEEDL